MGIKNRIKESSSKLFDYPSLKGKELKESVKNKIREKAILRTKARLAEHHKTFDDYSNEELEIIIIDEENKIKDDLKTKSLIGALAILGLDFLV